MTSGRPQIVNASASDHDYGNLDPESYTAHRLVRAFQDLMFHLLTDHQRLGTRLP